MHAVIIEKTGKPERLMFTEVSEPQAGIGQVRVRLAYAGINYADILSRKGLYGWRPKDRAYILGMEGSGVIDQVGPEVDENWLGREVMVGTQYGCYAEKVCVPVQQVLPIPVDFSMEEGAAFLVNFMTAWVSLFELARLKEKETVLITAAAGGVGTAAVKLCAALGAHIYALAGNETKLELVRSMGAHRALNYRTTAYDQIIEEECGGIDVVLELVGGEIFRKNLQLLNLFGRMVVAGFASFNLKKWNPFSWYRTYRNLPRVNIAYMSHKSLGIFSTHLGYLLKDVSRLKKSFQQLSSFVTEHAIRPHIGGVFLLDEVAEAHRYIESRQSMGKVLLKIH